MADVVLTVQTVARAGVAPSYTTLDAVDTYYLPNTAGRTFLHFKNTNAGVCTVIVDVTKQIEGESITDPTISVPATTGDVMAGAWSVLYEQASGTHKGRVKFSQDLATGVTVAAIRV